MRALLLFHNREKEKNRDLFGSLLTYLYLCNVKCMFDYPVNVPSECREEQALIDTTPFKATFQG